MSTITELRSSNVKRLTAVSITPPATGAVVVGGRNGQGKSSLLDSILFALAGKNAQPDKPVRVGADEAEIELTINTTPPLIVRRKIKPDGKSTLELKQLATTGYESKVSSPQKVLDSLVGTVAFDPLAFTRMKPQDQVETLKRLVGVDTLDLDAEIETKMELRKNRKRDLESFESMTATMPRHDEIPANAQPRDPGSVKSELDAANANNQKIDRLDDDIAEKRRSLESAADLVARLKAQLQEAEARIEEIRSDLLDSEDARERMAPIDLQPILDKSGEIAAYNQKLKANQQYRDRLETHKQRTAEIDDLTASVDALRQDRIDMMTQAKWPVAGLGFDGQGVTFNDLPFTQCSSAEQLRVSTAIGMAQNPQLKLMLIRDGSLLDESNLDFLHQLAIENDAQVWIERVSSGDECCIVIEDGTTIRGGRESKKELATSGS